MSNIAFLNNVASATKLKEGSIAELMKRIQKLEAGMSDVEKAKIDTLLADAFVSVSAHLDIIEAGSSNKLPNQRAPLPRYGSQAWRDLNRTKETKLPSSDDKALIANAEKDGFHLPKAAD